MGKILKGSLGVVVSVAVLAWGANQKTFYVYGDKGSQANHFAPSGWMGDYGDLKLNDASTDNCIDGRTCIKWTYSGEGKQGANWVGCYWQQPPNNWGDKQGGFDLSGFKHLTFWARGEKGGETLTEVYVGGITGEYADSDRVGIGPVTLTKEWKKYSIDISQANLSHVIGGFGWSTNKDANPTTPISFYLDEIRFEG